MRLAIVFGLAGAVWLVSGGGHPLRAAGNDIVPGLSVPSFTTSATQPTASESLPSASNDDHASIAKALEAAMAERQKMTGDVLPAPPAALQEEVLERNRLIEQLADTLTRHLDAVDRLPGTRRRAAERQAELAAWRDFATPPPYSILKVDQLRAALDAADVEAKGATTRRDWEAAEQAEGERRYKAAAVQERQCDERIALQSSGDGRDRQIWLRDLARLHGRVAAEAVAEAQIQMTLADANHLVKQAEMDLLGKQLARARKSIRFNQDDLDKVLSSIDRQREVLESRSKTLILAGPAIRRDLDRAQQALAAAQTPSSAAPDAARRIGEQSSNLEQMLVWRRLQADNHDLAVDFARRMLELRTMERTAWQYRWLLVNSGDIGKQREAGQELQRQIDRLEEWGRFVDGQISVIAGRFGDDFLTQREVSGELDVASHILTARREQADLYRDAQQAVQSLQRTFIVWREEFVATQGDAGSWAAQSVGWWRMAREGVSAFWDLELFSAEDNVDIDGRRVVARRSVTVGKSLGVVLLLVLGYFLTDFTFRGIRHVAVQRLGMKRGHTQTVLRWARFVLLAMLFIVALYLVNIPLTIFAFLGGALAIGVGFGTQVLLKNMISGIMLLVERPLRVGDMVEVGSVVGTVTNISIRSSTVRTSDGIEILVPNSTFIENNVTNWTYSNAKVRRSVSVGVEYGADTATVSEILLRVAADHADVVLEPGPRVLLDDFGPDALAFKLQYWIDYGKGADGSLIASQLRVMIERELAKAGIDIPLPQRVVHITRDNPTA